MTAPRFYVTEFSGFRIGEPGRSGGTSWVTTFQVYDRIDNHKLIASYGRGKTATTPRRTLAAARKAAEKRCADLNAWHEQRMANG